MKKTMAEILNMSYIEMNQLTKSDIMDIIHKVASEVNRKYSRLLKKGLASHATRGFERAGGITATDFRNPKELYEAARISTKGKTFTQLKHELTRGIDFINAKTNTATGIKKAQQKSIDTLKERGIDITSLTKDAQKEFWDELHKLTETELESEWITGSQNTLKSVVELVQKENIRISDIGGSRDLLSKLKSSISGVDFDDGEFDIFEDTQTKND